MNDNKSEKEITVTSATPNARSVFASLEVMKEQGTDGISVPANTEKWVTVKGNVKQNLPEDLNEGFDLNYAGVILGPSVKYRNGKIIFDPNESCNTKAIRNRTLSDGSKKKFGEIMIQHEVRVLMTRGVNGLYIYACDPQLRKALKDAQK